MTNTTGTNLYRIVKALGFTVVELSEKSGISRNVIYRLMNGDENGYLDTWLRIIRALGVSPNAMFRGHYGDNQASQSGEHEQTD